VVERYPDGDHTIFLGEVVECGRMGDQGPLVFFQGRYVGIA
jgi:flavin reductase (DIM6/NTAB) family NADH-FMN oxidoreductase RutF